MAEHLPPSEVSPVPEHVLRYCLLPIVEKNRELLEHDRPVALPEATSIVDINGFTSYATGEPRIARRGGRMGAEYILNLSDTAEHYSIHSLSLNGDEWLGVGSVDFLGSVHFALHALQRFLETAERHPDVIAAIQQTKDAGVHFAINFPRADEHEPVILRRIRLGRKEQIANIGPKTAVKSFKDERSMAITATTPIWNGANNNDSPDVVISGHIASEELNRLEQAGLIIHKDLAHPPDVELIGIEVPDNRQLDDIIAALDYIPPRPTSEHSHGIINDKSFIRFAHKSGPVFQHESHFLPRPPHVKEGLNDDIGAVAFPFITGFRQLFSELLRSNDLIANPDIPVTEKKRAALMLAADAEALTAESLADQLDHIGFVPKEFEDHSFTAIVTASLGIEQESPNHTGLLNRDVFNQLQGVISSTLGRKFREDVSRKLEHRAPVIAPAVDRDVLRGVVDESFRLHACVGIMAAGFGDPRVNWGIEEPDQGSFWQFSFYGSIMPLAARAGAIAYARLYERRLEELKQLNVSQDLSPALSKELSNLTRLDKAVQEGGCIVVPKNVAEKLKILDHDSILINDISLKGVRTRWDLVFQPIEPHS